MTDSQMHLRDGDRDNEGSQRNSSGGNGDSHPVLRRLLHAMAAIPGMQVDRDAFLRKQLNRYCTQNDIGIDNAIDETPMAAGVPIEALDQMADSIIRAHTIKASSLSFATGLPGGWFGTATIPVDLAQLYWHAAVCAQKLMYLYGWDNLFEHGELHLDEETELRIWLLIGVMFGVGTAVDGLREVARLTQANAAYRIAKYPLTKTPFYGPLKYALLRTIGVRLTKSSFARGVSRFIPIAGGGISASITAISLNRMTKNLKGHLRGIAI